MNVLSKPSLATVLLLACALPAHAQDTPTPLAQQATLSRAKGRETASVFVYAFTDFQCTHCQKFAIDVFPRIDSAFVRSGKIRWIFVHLPLPTHANAWAAHEAAACAGGVADRFWQMHDRLYATQQEWAELPDPTPVFTRLAREVGAPADRFAACIREDRVANVILGDVIFGATSNVSGTPAYIVNNEVTVMGLKSFEEWKELLEKMIRKK